MVVDGQLSGLSGVIPERSSASDVTTLNVDPGAYVPSVAVDSPSPPGPLAAASTSPVDGRNATMALAGTTGASSSSADCWRATSSVSASGSPARGSRWNSTRFTGPAEAVMVSPGLPRNCSSYCFCNPLSPARSPATMAPSEPSTISAVAGPTAPSSGLAKVRVGASGSVSGTAFTPCSALNVATSYAGSPTRTTIASTKAFSPAAATRAA